MNGKIGSFIYHPSTNLPVPGSITDRALQPDPTGANLGVNASSVGEDGFGELYLADINGEVCKLIPSRDPRPPRSH